MTQETRLTEEDCAKIQASLDATGDSPVTRAVIRALLSDRAARNHSEIPNSWTPASTPPPGTGMYVVAIEDAYGNHDRDLAWFNPKTYLGGWSRARVVAYLPTPLPPLEGK